MGDGLQQGVGMAPASSTHSTSLPSAFVILAEQRPWLVECSPGPVCSLVGTQEWQSVLPFWGHPVGLQLLPSAFVTVTSLPLVPHFPFLGVFTPRC